MKVKFKKEDFYKCFEFPVRYYLDDTKSKSNRTTGQQRGLGSIINDFFLGKLIEIGVARAINERNDAIKCELDFNIHEAGENHNDDPDILNIIENGQTRKPRLFIEVKNISENDRFIGLTTEQCKTMLQSTIINNDASKLYIIYASVLSKDSEKICDVFGAYLKSEIADNLLDGFAGIDDIYLEIKSVINAKELIEHGIEFNKGSLFYETNLLGEEIVEVKAVKIKNLGYKKVHLSNEKMPVIMMNDYPEPKEFGDFKLFGEVDLFVKNNEKSRRVYLDAKSNGRITNKMLGDFIFQKDKMYEVFFTTMGRNPILSRNNLWIARRNLSNLIKDSATERIDYIAKNI